MAVVVTAFVRMVVVIVVIGSGGVGGVGVGVGVGGCCRCGDFGSWGVVMVVVVVA